MPDQPETLSPAPVAPSQLHPAVAPARRQTVLWLIAVLLAIIATAMVVRRDEPFLGVALGQTSGLPRTNMEGGRGIYAFAGQIGDRKFGLFMLDVDNGTVWCYELQRSGASAEPKLNLIAARSWVYDRYLEEFNTGVPIPREVQAMVQQQRTNRPPATSPGGGAGSD